MSILAVAIRLLSFQSLALLDLKDGGPLHVPSSPRKKTQHPIRQLLPIAAEPPPHLWQQVTPFIATRTLPLGIDTLGCAESGPLRKSNAVVTD